MNQQSKFLPALWGGLLIGVISGVPGLNLINCACCAGVIGGGIFAVYMFRRDAGPYAQITSTDGVVLGLVAGLIGAVLASILAALFGTASMEMLEQAKQYIDDPDARQMLDQLSGQGMSAGIFFISMMLNVVIYAIFGLIGGLIGASLFGKNKPKPETSLDEPQPPVENP